MKKVNFIVILVSLFLLGSCSKKEETISTPIPVEVKSGNHSWYYFSSTNFHSIDKPQNTPSLPYIPWTEAKRISSANVVANQTENQKAYGVVNRLGILCFENDKVSLTKDINLFGDRTAGNLVFLSDTPVFSVYKSAFFNDTITDPLYKNDKTQHLFLVQYDDVAKICYPLINCNNLTEELNSEITDFTWDGLNWICSVKTISDIKNSFSYINWKPTVSLLNLSPASAGNTIYVEECDVDDFRNSKALLPYSNIPQRVKKLLSGFDSKTNFLIEVKSAGGTSPRVYENNEIAEEAALKATAVISQSWSAALFEDGTLFIEGALPGKHILRGGKPVAIRLPKLPAGFVYSDFVISGTTLYAAWEEASFYNTARSGFLKVNLDKTLYSKLL